MLKTLKHIELKWWMWRTNRPIYWAFVMQWTKHSELDSLLQKKNKYCVAWLWYTHRMHSSLCYSKQTTAVVLPCGSEFQSAIICSSRYTIVLNIHWKLVCAFMLFTEMDCKQNQIKNTHFIFQWHCRSYNTIQRPAIIRFNKRSEYHWNYQQNVLFAPLQWCLMSKFGVHIHLRILKFGFLLIRCSHFFYPITTNNKYNNIKIKMIIAAKRYLPIQMRKKRSWRHRWLQLLLATVKFASF